MSGVSLIELVTSTHYLVSQITAHPDFQSLDYQPDLTIDDALTALSYLKDELETNQELSITTEIAD
ncbi:unknown protein (plasmid) [Nostoc sp. NIES-3756]|uniref:hypothetical protein n=1 Tax=Nostoc sp. NIES-3756 TaxID=1751286 RepID=UPI00071FD76A|nr:hypothetical protein [Nostoc sp. NIES-3756]BAT56690.1 unknown protein [Nostoc sp. NIES-3756]